MEALISWMRESSCDCALWSRVVILGGVSLGLDAFGGGHLWRRGDLRMVLGLVAVMVMWVWKLSSELLCGGCRCG